MLIIVVEAKEELSFAIAEALETFKGEAAIYGTASVDEVCEMCDRIFGAQTTLMLSTRISAADVDRLQEAAKKCEALIKWRTV